jgi:hypothetical protein
MVRTYESFTRQLAGVTFRSLVEGVQAAGPAGAEPR